MSILQNTVKNKPDYALLSNAVYFVLIHVWYFVFLCVKKNCILLVYSAYFFK